MVVRPRSSRTARLVLTLAFGALAIGALAGCAQQPAHTGSSARHTAEASGTATVKPTAKPQSTPTAKPTPVGLSCDQVVSPAQLSAFNPKLSRDDAFSPEKGSNVAAAVKQAGVGCGYADSGSGNSLSLALAHPAASTLTAVKQHAAATSNIVPTYGTPPAVEGYFAEAAGSGEAQVFSKGYWLVLRSKDFAEPGDPAPLIASILSNLPG